MTQNPVHDSDATTSTLNERLSNMAERKAAPILFATKQDNIDLPAGMFLFDVLSQWVFDELCCDLDRDADSRSPAAKMASLQQVAATNELEWLVMINRLRP